MTTSEQATADGAEPRDRIDRYLRENGLDGAGHDGCAADRRRVRPPVLPDHPA